MQAAKLAKVYVPQPRPYARRLLAALNASGKHIYAGTVPFKEICRRRAANKVARKSRRINRG